MDLTSLIGGLVKPALDAVFRWKEGEDKMEITRQQYDLMKKNLEADIEVRLAEERRKPDSELRSFILDFEGKAEDQTPFMRNFRSSVRPIITYWALIIITVVILGWVSGDVLSKNLAAIPKPLWEIFLAIFGFWFGGRAIMQVAEAWKKGDSDRQAEVNKGQTEVKRLELERAKVEAAQNTEAPVPAAPVKQDKNPWDDQPW